jgi:ketosteroid isomerase-like protein
MASGASDLYDCGTLEASLLNIRKRIPYVTSVVLVLAITVTTVVSGCKSTPVSNSSNIAQNPAPAQPDEATIRALDAQWSESAGAHNLDATVEPYADGAILLPPDATAITDPKAIRAYWRAFLESVKTVAWEVKTIEVAKSGELAYVTGSWTTTAMGPKDSIVTDTGKLVEIWQKQTDGKWKCTVDTFNYDSRPTPQ